MGRDDTKHNWVERTKVQGAGLLMAGLGLLSASNLLAPAVLHPGHPALGLVLRLRSFQWR